MVSKKISEMQSKVMELLPSECEVTKVEMEGPELAIYTRKPETFHQNEAYVSKVAFELKKRVNIRTDKSLLIEPEKAKKLALKIIPEEAGIKEISFNEPFSEIIIEAIKPGLVIGKGGETSKKLIRETGWTPNILRAPTSESRMLKGIRGHIARHGTERKKLLKETAERIYRDVEINERDWARITMLGGFKQVGRSSMLLETPHSKVIIDCGINLASKQEAYPYLDALNFPLTEIDAVVLSHAHTDHSGFIPYLFKMGYEGPVYCTLPTRDLMALICFDYVDVTVKEGREPPYSERDVKKMIQNTIPREYREVTDITPDIKISFHNASHILGSSSVHFHIGEGQHNLVYSGDIKFGFTRLFNSVDIKYPRIETLILESTYGSKTDILPDRTAAENKLVNIIKEVMDKKGTILIPVFGVGRGQEMELTIENFYQKGLIGDDIKIYVDGMTREANAIHTAYPEFLRASVQKRILQNNSPFDSKIFLEAKPEDRENIVKEGKTIILASSGMLTGGPSLEYFKLMADDPKNCVVFVGYQGMGSLGRNVQTGLTSMPVTDTKGKTKKLDIVLRTETVEGFSGHSDRNELVNYFRNLSSRPKRVLIGHGEQEKHKNLQISYL